MEVEITNSKEFICEGCGEETEFRGYYNHTLRKLCPHCACEEVVEIVNIKGDNKMKIKTIDYKGRNVLFQLEGWEKDDWLLADEFLKELIESEANYEIMTKRMLKRRKTK